MAHFGELLDAAKRTEVCLADLPGFIPPLQVRTQKKTDLIVSSTAHLLQSSSFESVSIQEIAKLSKCSVTSIYARFVDKEALIPAVNLIIMEHYRLVVVNSFLGVKMPDVESICRTYINLNSTFYRDNANFIKAAASIKSDLIFKQMNDRFNSSAAILSSAMENALRPPPPRSISQIEFGIQQVHTNFRDRIICGDIQSFNIASLTWLFCTILQDNNL